MKRSAGTNYQALVSYAIARFLIHRKSAWTISQPVPKELKAMLSVVFFGGINPNEHDMGEGSHYTVSPDVDIILRNVAWKPANAAEPAVLLSLKTSLADRAGQAARWKTYFDLATHPCPLSENLGCAYRRLGIHMRYANRFSITHGIVTANIYKRNYQIEKHHAGELATGQTRSNTYMFDHRFTTRDDSIAHTPTDWKQLHSIGSVLNSISEKAGLPK